VQNRLNAEFTRARKAGEDFDASAFVDRAVQEESEQIKSIVTTENERKANLALDFANQLAKNYEDAGPFTNYLEAHSFLNRIRDQRDVSATVKSAQPRIPGKINDLNRMLLRSE
jgi:hypothetical protein